MANALIPVSTSIISNESVQTVDARVLHTFLESKEEFAHWIKQRIDQYGFIENQDFVSFRENSQKPKGGRPSKEYTLTLDTAKELSMVERNEKGKQARQYFIECEKRMLRELTPKQKALPHGLTPDQQDTIKSLVKARVEALPEDKRAKAAITCWSSLKSKFGCTYKEIPSEQFTDAVSLVARVPLEGEVLEKFCGTDEEVTLTLKEHDCYQIYAFFRMVASFKLDLQFIEAALRTVKSPMAQDVYDMYADTSLSVTAFMNGIGRQIQPIFEKYQQRYRMNGC